MLLTLPLVLAACTGERDRPSPTDPDVPAQLSVEVVAPAQNQVVIAGRGLDVSVLARDFAGEHLVGIGFVVRHAGTVLDSAAVSFSGTHEETRTFTFVVPPRLITNTQLDIYGLAFGTGDAMRESRPRSVVVAQCEPAQPGC